MSRFDHLSDWDGDRDELDPWDIVGTSTEPETDNFLRYQRKNEEKAAAKILEENRTKLRKN